MLGSDSLRGETWCLFLDSPVCYLIRLSKSDHQSVWSMKLIPWNYCSLIQCHPMDNEAGMSIRKVMTSISEYLKSWNHILISVTVQIWNPNIFPLLYGNPNTKSKKEEPEAWKYVNFYISTQGSTMGQNGRTCTAYYARKWNGAEDSFRLLMAAPSSKLQVFFYAELFRMDMNQIFI